MGWYQRSHRLLVVFDISQKMMVSNWEPYYSKSFEKAWYWWIWKGSHLVPSPEDNGHQFDPAL